ncbi:MAG: hypothetical protein RR327_08655, partial [Clostridia bacterium]
MARKVKKAIIITMIALVIIGVLAVLFLKFAQASSPPSYYNENMKIGCDLIDVGDIKSVKSDDFGRVLYVSNGVKKPLGQMYFIMQKGKKSFWGEDKRYKKGVYYYFDYENKGENTEEFQQFLNANDWDNSIATAENDLELLFKKTDSAMCEESYSPGSNFRENYAERIRKINPDDNSLSPYLNDLQKFIATTTSDQFCRSIVGVVIPSANGTDLPKIYAFCFQALRETQTYYLNDTYFAEIR